MTDKMDSGTEKDTDLATSTGQSRRKFAKTGLAGGAALMTLANRPALGKPGGGGWNPMCSVDVLYSIYNGGSEYDFDPTQCLFGCTPGFWQGGTAADRAWYEIGMLTTPPLSQNSLFVDVFPCGNDVNGNDVNELVLGELGLGEFATLVQVVSMPNEGLTPLKQAARNSVAGLLNSIIMGIFYAPLLDPETIVSNFCTAATAWANDETAVGGLNMIHNELGNLNENQNNCPLNAEDDNPFYGDYRIKLGL